VTSSLVQGLSFQLSAAQVRRLDPANPRGGRILQDYRRHQEETTSEAGPRTVDQHEVDRITAAALTEVLSVQTRKQFHEACSLVGHSIADVTISSAAMGDRA
jgi:hypothetical protein